MQYERGSFDSEFFRNMLVALIPVLLVQAAAVAATFAAIIVFLRFIIKITDV